MKWRQERGEDKWYRSGIETGEEWAEDMQGKGVGTGVRWGKGDKREVGIRRRGVGESGD